MKPSTSLSRCPAPVRMALLGTLCVATLRCGSGNAGGADIGPISDAGPVADAGPTADAAPTIDAGPTPDAGPAADAGFDGGPSSDSGVPDSGATPCPSCDGGNGSDGGINWDEPAPPCTGTSIPPGLDTLQGPIAAAGTGTTFCLAAGEYRVTYPAKLKQQQSVYGAGATLTFVYGSTVVTQWSDAGSAWVADLTLPDSGSLLDGTIIDLNADFVPAPPFLWGADSFNYWFDHSRGDTFYAGERLTRVGEIWDGGVAPGDAGLPTRLLPGQLFVDYDQHLVYIGSDPSQAQVEVALAPSAFAPEGAAATGVTIAYLAVQRFGNQIAAGGNEEPIACAAGWTVHHVDGSFNHGPAVHLFNSISLSHSRFFDNGCLGAGGGVFGGLIDSCDFEENNKEIRVQPGTGNGGIKFGATLDTIIRNSIANGNFGPGIWFDGGSRFFMIIGNTVQNNLGQGIRNEIGFECVIRDNVVSGSSGVPGDKGDIVMAASGAADVSQYPLDPFWLDAGFGNSIEIYGNMVSVGDAGEMAIDVGQAARYNPTPFDPDGGLHLARNVHVHDNTVSLSGLYEEVGVTDNMPADSGVNPWSAGNTFVGNHYVTGGNCNKDFWTWGGVRMTFSEWQDAGQDSAPGGSCN
jgi:parallel beta-helix repeat protein